VTSGYWPWWAIAPALAGLTVGHWILVRRPLGVSGVLARFSRVREELEFDRGTATMQSDEAALQAAMEAATAELLGSVPVAATASLAVSAAPAFEPAGVASPAEPAAERPGRVCAPTPPLSGHLTFLVALAVGGFLAAVLRGSFGAGMGEAFARHVSGGPEALAALAGGGVLIGFGTALCGGCTAGNGLTGCGRLMPGSLVATATFFGAAVAVSLALGGLAP
jgi:uncharacterized protein